MSVWPGQDRTRAVTSPSCRICTRWRVRRCRNPVLTPSTVAFHRVSILFATHEAYLDHLAGPRHQERPERLGAVIDGMRVADLADAIIPLVPQAAVTDDLLRVHTKDHVHRIEQVSLVGGGRLDPDTVASAGSWNAALLAAGAGLTAVEALRAGDATSAFCAVRPPGHHATRSEAMGFCLISNVAVTAAKLADQGERVLIVDFDAHHGNGTQDVFFTDERVLFISLHQWPLYPGTGWYDEVGSGPGMGTTMNIPLPAGTTGDVYLSAFDRLIAPMAESFAPTWLIVSAGYDAHRNDPITDMALSAADYALMMQRLLGLVPPGRTVVMLEGGYDLDALSTCTAATLGALAGASGLSALAGASGRAVAMESATSGGSQLAWERLDEIVGHWDRLDLQQ